MFCQRGSNSDNSLLGMRGERIQIPLKAGHYLPTSETLIKAFRWPADDGPILNTGLVAL